jgi:hypothetical protein
MLTAEPAGGNATFLSKPGRSGLVRGFWQASRVPRTVTSRQGGVDYGGRARKNDLEESSVFPAESASRGRKFSVRAVVAIYLSIITLLGPAAFCCCTTRALAAALFATGRPDAPPAVTPAPEPQPGNGCHCKQRASARPGTPETRPAPAKAPPPPCPCKEHGKKPVLTETEPAIARALESSLLPTGWVAFDAFSSPDYFQATPSGPQFATGPERRPFLTAQDLLCAHHLLRC